MKYYNKAGKEPIRVYEAPACSQAASLPVFSYFVKTNRNQLLFNDNVFPKEHGIFSSLGGTRWVVRNPTLTDLTTSKNPLIPPHQAWQQNLRTCYRATGPVRPGQHLLVSPCNAVAMQRFPSSWHPRRSSNPQAGSGCLQHLQGDTGEAKAQNLGSVLGPSRQERP